MDQERPRLDLEVSLLPAERRELFREALRLSGFWSRVWTLAVLIPGTAAIAVLLGAPTAPATRWATVLLCGLIGFAACYPWAGPRLGRAPAGRSARTLWRVSADRVETDRQGRRVELTWQDIDRVVITRSLIVVQLGERDGVLGLPRRAAGLGEALITSWADDSGADVLHRRSARCATPASVTRS